VTQTTEALGKTAGKDPASAKATYPAIGGVEASEKLARAVHAEVIDAISKLGVRSDLLVAITNFFLVRRS